MIKLRSLLFEQTNFKNTVIDQLKRSGFQVDASGSTLTKNGMTIVLGDSNISSIIFPYKVDIKNMGADNIKKELSNTFDAIDVNDNIISSREMTAQDIEYAKTLSAKEKAQMSKPMSPTDPGTNFKQWQTNPSFLSKLNISTIGPTIEGTTISKYIPDLIKLGNIASQWQKFQNSSSADQLKTVGTDLKNAAQNISKTAGASVKGAIANLKNK